MKERRERLTKLIPEYDILISTYENMRYYSGFTGEGYLLRADGVWRILTDSRYTEQASLEAPDLPVTDVRDLPGMFINSEGIAVEGSLPLNSYMKLPRDKVRIMSERIGAPRMIKDEEEIGKIARAERTGDRAFSYILDLLRPGMSEREIANRLEFYMKDNGAEALSFDVIAASGPDSSMPHARPGDRELAEGDFLIMDYGYCSDMTRTVAAGKISPEMEEVYDIVKGANELAIDRIRPGMKAREADRVAREYIDSRGYGRYFSHALGHSVGLAIHEAPALSGRDETVLAPGMLVTVEPGIYLPGKFGVRIEDLVLITEDGKKVLSRSEKDLITV